MEVLKNEHDYVQERCLGGDADRHGRQGVPLGVQGLHADARERPDKGICGKLPV
jgi:hypothetical protein